MTDKRFQAFKKATNGSAAKWGYVTDLTHEEARDTVRFPLGKQEDADGREYIWTYSLMPQYADPPRRKESGR
ncbi:hypothetical protein [Rhizobium phage RHph_X2_26]|nr:hypothetical protein [Rhizobium phage RHph_X2_26]